MVKRDKAVTNVEFAVVLLLAEISDGLVSEWQLYEQTPSDAHLGKESLERVESAYEIPVQMLSGDWGIIIVIDQQGSVTD